MDESTERKHWYHEEYLKSEWWAKMREERLKFDGYKCAWCGCKETKDNPLNVHHLSYDYLGCENVEDLTTLCRDCHERLHVALEELRPIKYQIERDWEREAQIALREVSDKYKGANAYLLSLLVYYIIRGKSVRNLSKLISTVKDAFQDCAGESEIKARSENSIFTMTQQIVSCLRKPKEKRPEQWMVEASRKIKETVDKNDLRDVLQKYKKKY